jgi:hypothetical protein
MGLSLYRQMGEKNPIYPAIPERPGQRNAPKMIEFRVWDFRADTTGIRLIVIVSVTKIEF